MATHNDIGKEGEALARKHLEANGFAILERNWRCGKYEVDIIAYREGLLVFVEVKTRGSDDYGAPETFVDRRKQRAYIVAANQYVIEHGNDEEVRFDIIAIENDADGSRLNHIENAFCAIDC